MTSLSEVYDRGSGEATLQRLYLGVALFVVGAGFVLSGIVVASTNVGTTTLGLSNYGAREVAGIRVLAERLEGADPDSLRDTVDQLKNKLGSGIVVLGTDAGRGVRLVAGVTPDLTDRFKAGELVNHVAGQVGGKGGGRPDFAQAGGSRPEALGPALGSVYDWVAERAS